MLAAVRTFDKPLIWNGSGAVFLHLVLTIGLCAAISAVLDAEIDADSMLTIWSVVFVLLSIWMLASWVARSGSWLDPYSLFLATAALFNGGHAILECFGLNRHGFLFDKVSAESSSAGLAFVILCLSALHLGALAAATPGREPECLRTQPMQQELSALGARVTGWILLAISAVPAGLMLKDTFLAALAGGYFSAVFGRVADTGFDATPRVIAGFLIPAALFLLAGSAGRRPVAYASVIIVGLYSGTYLLIGSRMAATMPCLALVWLWDRCVSPVSKVRLLSAGAAALFLVFPLIAVMRSAGGDRRYDPNELMRTWSEIENPLASGLSEVGGTLLTVVYTMDLVPQSRGFGMGSSYVMAGSTVFPNLFWPVHPSVSYRSPGNWVTQAVDPATAAAGGGLGYSFIAEAYFNFGWPGAPLLMLLLGAGLGRLATRTSQSPDAARLAFAASLLTFLVWFVRNESGGMVRGFVWYSLLPYLLSRVLSLPAAASVLARLRLARMPGQALS